MTHQIHPKRIRQLAKHEYSEGPILYWMDRDRRIQDNWALLHAQNIALQHSQPLAIIYVVPPTFLEGTWRQQHFMIEGLKEIEESIKSKNIHFQAIAGNPSTEVPKFCKKHNIGYLVTDFSPLKLPQSWRTDILQDFCEPNQIPFDEVDTHNIIPCWHASPKKEFAAYTIRPKIHTLTPEFLTEIPQLKKHSPDWPNPESTDWKEIIDSLEVDRSIEPVKWIKPGEKAAHEILKKFLSEKLTNYSTDRNDPTQDALSNLSPFIHYGMISSQRIALETCKIDQPTFLKKAATTTKSAATTTKSAATTSNSTASSAPSPLQESIDSFLEELIVRRELADNFCFYEPNYDKPSGFHEWAQTTLNNHKDDEREYIYTQDQFEKAETHDLLWNAAQKELVNTGKMHGYMRMYWCKKILEWTNTPQFAQNVAIYLNDKYELDGRDPNGYTGVAWSIGGVHDRAWTERHVYGKIRYMNYNGCKRKFDVQAYIDKHLNNTEQAKIC